MTGNTMGTRGLVRFKRKSLRKNLVSIYHHFDGYPMGVGRQLARFLCTHTLVRGVNANPEVKFADGLGCLAAQYIAAVKRDSDDVYLMDANADDQEYVYVVIVDEDSHTVQIKASNSS